MHGAAAEVEEEHEGPCHGAGQASTRGVSGVVGCGVHTGHGRVVGDVLGNVLLCL